MVDAGWAFACVRDNLTAWNHRDWPAFESLHAPSVVYESPHSRVVGRSAVVRRYGELVAIVPDLHASELRMTDNDRPHHRATFDFLQTGTLAANVDTPSGRGRGPGSPFVVHTTMFVRFDNDGRMVEVRTLHD